MLPDWQTIVVWLIIVAAFLYVARRGWGRVRSFRAGGKAPVAASSCASGCGGCGDERPARPATRPQKVLVQITNAGSASSKRPG